MKKKILFIMESMRIGGAEKSLTTILNLIDYSRYDIDLFLFSQSGDFMNLIPKEVNILPEDKAYTVFLKNRKLSFIKFFIQGKFKLSFYSLKWNINALLNKLMRKKLYIGWDNISHFFGKLDKEYDTSIAFLERKTIYFNVDKVNSKNKIGFIHNDYSKYPYDDKLDRYYFKYYNKIPTVSDHCRDVLVSIFPEYKDKFMVIKNMVSKELILKLAEVPIDKSLINNDNNINIVSVGRLTRQKGFDRIIQICEGLKAKDTQVKWYIVGDGEEKKNLERMIMESSLEDNVILVGKDSNPYRWIKFADIYVQPSRFEGYGITVAEAKKMQKAMVVSDIPEFHEILDNDEAFFADSEENFIMLIEKMISDSNLRIRLQNNLSNDSDDTTQLEQLYKIL